MGGKVKDVNLVCPDDDVEAPCEGACSWWRESGGAVEGARPHEPGPNRV